MGAHAFSPWTSLDEALGHSYCRKFGFLLLKTILRRLSSNSFSFKGRYSEIGHCHAWRPPCIHLLNPGNSPHRWHKQSHTHTYTHPTPPPHPTHTHTPSTYYSPTLCKWPCILRVWKCTGMKMNGYETSGYLQGYIIAMYSPNDNMLSFWFGS